MRLHKLKNLSPYLQRQQIEYQAKMRAQSEKAAKYKDNLRVMATKAEKRLIFLLKKESIKFKFQAAFYNLENKCFIVDFLIKHYGTNICIEVDGGYHFSTTKQRNYDAYRQKWLEENRKCKFVRVTNEEVFENPGNLINRILKAKERAKLDYEAKILEKKNARPRRK